MRAYQRNAEGQWTIIQLVPKVMTRVDFIQEWVEADILPLLYNPGITAMEETLKVYMSVSDEEIEKAKTDYLLFKKGKFNTKPVKKLDIPVPERAVTEQFVSPGGYRFGDKVRLQNGETAYLDRIQFVGVWMQSSGNRILVPEELIAEVIKPAPILELGEPVRFFDPLNKVEAEGKVEGFSINSDDVFVRVIRDGRKVPVTINVHKLTQMKRSLKTA